MQIRVKIDGTLRVYSVVGVSDCENGKLLIMPNLNELPIVVTDVQDITNTLKRLAVFDWLDLSEYPAYYLEYPTTEPATDFEDIDREIDPYVEFER